jgi:hypothetical protein
MEIESLLWMTAYHEAGHAVAAYCHRRGVVSVSIVPDLEANRAGCCEFTRLGFMDRYYVGPFRLPDHAADVWERWAPRGRARFLRTQGLHALIALAGPAAQLRYSSNVADTNAGWGSDIDIVTEATHWLFPKCPELVETYLRDMSARAAELVNDSRNWVCIERLAGALMRRRTLSGRRLRSLLAAA